MEFSWGRRTAGGSFRLNSGGLVADPAPLRCRAARTVETGFKKTFG